MTEIQPPPFILTCIMLVVIAGNLWICECTVSAMKICKIPLGHDLCCTKHALGVVLSATGGARTGWRGFTDCSRVHV